MAAGRRLPPGHALYFARRCLYCTMSPHNGACPVDCMLLVLVAKSLLTILQPHVRLTTPASALLTHRCRPACRKSRPAVAPACIVRPRGCRRWLSTAAEERTSMRRQALHARLSAWWGSCANSPAPAPSSSATRSRPRVGWAPLEPEFVSDSAGAGAEGISVKHVQAHRKKILVHLRSFCCKSAVFLSE